MDGTWRPADDVGGDSIGARAEAGQVQKCSIVAAPGPASGRGGFGERLNQALRQRGVRKIYPLALELGIDESALSRWRKGGAISLDSAIRLAEHLDVSLDWLLTGRGGMDGHKAVPPLTAEDQRLLEALRTMRERLSAEAVRRLSEPDRK